jgi:glycosyltransferase involved in cell wall biosynthesis
MRVAIVFPEPYDPARVSLDLGLLVEGFGQCGAEARIVGVSGSTTSFAHPTDLVPNVGVLESTAFWKEREFDLVVVVTWGTRAPILRAVRAAGSVVVSKVDTDGLIGVRSYPLTTLSRSLWHQPTLRGRAGALWFWLKKLAYWHRVEEGMILESLEAAHVAWLESPAAQQGVTAFLLRHGRVDLKQRLVAFPNPVGAAFRGTDAREVAGPHVAAVGRWDDPQKNGPLLAAALKNLAERRPGSRFTVIGRGSGDVFQSLSKLPGARLHERLTRPEIAAVFGEAQVVAFSSRWEGGRSNVANEALAMGCTVVGPALPSFIDLAVEGRFGRVVARPSSATLAAALDDELSAWSNGMRDRAAIRAWWREQLDPRNVCAALLRATGFVPAGDGRVPALREA